MDAEDRDELTRRRPAVMADVGRLAGVSHQTVSRVINGSRHVSPATRERVHAAMRELGYRPNSIARALVTGRSHTLGVVRLDTALHGPASALCAIQRAAQAAGYLVIVVTLGALDRASVNEAVARLALQRVDGIVVLASREASGAEPLEDAHLPAVVVEGAAGERTPVVAFDHRAGAGLATRHLLELGHPTVWHVTGPPDTVESRERVQGWEAALASAGAPVPGPLAGDWTARSGYTLGQRLSREPEVSAVFVAGDEMALGLLRAMHEGGRAVPEDVSVVGCDDVPGAAFFTPPLTTVRQDFGELGRRSVRLLVGAIEHVRGEDVPAGARLAPELIVRASTAHFHGRGP